MLTKQRILEVRRVRSAPCRRSGWPPGGHIADARAALLPDGSFDLAVGTAEFGNGTTTVHRQIAAGELATVVDRITVRQSDTDVVRHDTGAFASIGVVVSGKATLRASRALADQILDFAAAHLRVPRGDCRVAEESVLRPGGRLPLKELYAAGRTVGMDFAADGHFGGTPRSVAFNAQWFRPAVDPGTGEIRILRSVHAADAGKVMNPMQCRGQVEGGVAQALGATLFENVRIDASGAVETAACRRYRLPKYADVPRTELHFMETADAIGPLGAKSMSESPFNPVAPPSPTPCAMRPGSASPSSRWPGTGSRSAPSRTTRCPRSANGSSQPALRASRNHTP